MVGIGFVGLPLLAAAQAPVRAPRIGWLSVASRTPEVAHLLGAFVEGLRDLGYVEGQNLAIDYRFADGKPERLPGFAAELLGLKVDVIVAPNPAGIRAAREATKTVPIVMLNATDPVASGLVASLARPGGNITGLTATADRTMAGKHVELCREAVPNVSRLAVLRNPANPDAAVLLVEVERVARAFDVQIRVVDVRAPDELEGAFARMARDRPGALVVLGDTMFFLHRARLARLAVKNRLSTVTGSREMAAAGLLMTYGQNQTYEFRRAAAYVDKILKGAKPADLPVEQPTH